LQRQGRAELTPDRKSCGRRSSRVRDLAKLRIDAPMARMNAEQNDSQDTQKDPVARLRERADPWRPRRRQRRRSLMRLTLYKTRRRPETRLALLTHMGRFGAAVGGTTGTAMTAIGWRPWHGTWWPGRAASSRKSSTGSKPQGKPLDSGGFFLCVA